MFEEVYMGIVGGFCGNLRNKRRVCLSGVGGGSSIKFKVRHKL